MIIQLDEKFNIHKRKTKKTQILLCDTLRPYNHFINSIRYRYNGEYPKVPHYVVTKKGEIYNLFSSDYYSEFTHNKNSIVVCLENLGWLQKSSLAPMYTNWIGDVYRGEPFCARWKDRFFWDTYTADQIIALSQLVEILHLKHDIPKVVINHTASIPQPTKFKGILARCNYSNIFTDISPAFNTKLFEKLLNDEKQEQCK
jgi:N-acetyl-anhydromuramyl-L-alanine amidase AmpD